jgi:hypothetical protein
MVRGFASWRHRSARQHEPEGEPPVVLLRPLEESGSTQVGPRSEELFLVGGNSFVTGVTELKLSPV